MTRNTDVGTGIVCENRTELALVLSAIGDILDRNFWVKTEEEFVDMTIAGQPVYITDLFDKAKKEMTSGCRVVDLDETDERTHKAHRYIVYPFDADPREVINYVIFVADKVSKKKPYKI